MVHPQLEVDVSNYESKMPTHTCGQKKTTSFCDHDTFILTYYEFDIIPGENFIKGRIEYNKQLSEDYEEDVD